MPISQILGEQGCKQHTCGLEGIIILGVRPTFVLFMAFCLAVILFQCPLEQTKWNTLIEIFLSNLQNKGHYFQSYAIISLIT